MSEEEEPTVRLQFTMVVEYDAKPSSYGTSDPREMARIDQENFDSGAMSTDEFFDLGGINNNHVVQWIRPVIEAPKILLGPRD